MGLQPRWLLPEPLLLRPHCGPMSRVSSRMPHHILRTLLNIVDKYRYHNHDLRNLQREHSDCQRISPVTKFDAGFHSNFFSGAQKRSDEGLFASNGGGCLPFKLLSSFNLRDDWNVFLQH